MALLKHLHKQENVDDGECVLSSGIGVCACLAIRDGLRLTVANLGDCRALGCRKGALEILTQDHKPGE